MKLMLLLTFGICLSLSQKIIPFDTINWKIQAKAHVLENYKGYDAIYIQNGKAQLKGKNFKNGTIEFDVYLTERQAFPGVFFRETEKSQELFYLRPHLSGKPDANQALSAFGGISAWQLYFGPAYSFPYNYHFNKWTHIKIVVNNDKAQVFMDYSKKANLSWNLKHKAVSGSVSIGGSFAPVHYANFKINGQSTELRDFKPIKTKKIPGIVKEWQISDKFDEKSLDDLSNLKNIINKRKWLSSITVEENNAANISRVVRRYGSPGNTVFAKLNIMSDRKQVKLFYFGYSDRAVAFLNGSAIYKGNNKWRSRDYRYLGTIGLFDGIYLNLKKGKNTLLLAISEDFGGWGVTGKFDKEDGIKIVD